MLARINLLQIQYRHCHTRLLKRTPWLKNRLGLATFPKQIRLYDRFLDLHLGAILCTDYRKRHQTIQPFSTNNFGPQQMRSTRRADTMNGSTFNSIPFLWKNWAIFLQLQAFECAGRGWMARTRTRWMAICRWRFCFTGITSHASKFA